ncbi:MOSC domain-containing protein [Rhodococcus sp. NM-2]|uniref:MOSC and FAD-binding oxidoreductase domain-containing protein n=1 Tax=Rhodococcus TaxID=1827 RepID=UPI0024759DD1|nr:MOSC and FAD-binding oxidoreductase domain-containing protein [Rhodococcus opacus]MDH6287246.1 ferredoxin-NADP reductase/MOSC domain-containing protein YiiM/ferredoxin [Rhodococcus opacus]
MARLRSLNVGMPKDVPWQGRTVHTGIFKYPVDGPRMVRTLDIDGDGQGDLDGHGGEIRAVLVYQCQSYDFWRRQLGRDDLEYGQFGENFTVDGLPDDEVHIGDRYRIGDAEFEVTQPRVTCYRVGMRLGEPEMPALLVAHHRPGFYFRVITEGHVQAGDEIIRTRIGRHRMSVAAIDALLYLPDRDVGQLRTAVDIPALSPGWQRSFRDLLDAAEHPMRAGEPPAGAQPEGWAGFRPLRVSRIVPESTTVASIHLAPHDDTPLTRPKPGQHLTLRVAGAADPPPVRNYSLSAAPSDIEYRISVKRETHGLVSTYLHTQLRVGDTVDVASPRGDFVLPKDRDDATPVLLLSAGVGVTPVLAMLHALAAAHSKRDIWWLHTAHSAAEQAFAAEAHRLLTSVDRGHEHVYYTAQSPTANLDPPAAAGRINREALAALGLPANVTTYLCGPTAFMAAMREALMHLGVEPDRIHTELFGALSAINPGLTDVTHTPPHLPLGPVGTGPRITFTRSGLTAPWSGEYSTVLDFAEACDVPTRWSCRTGVCHTCQTPILSGTVRYRPDPLEPPMPGTTLLCCSQPESDLVLDL